MAATRKAKKTPKTESKRKAPSAKRKKVSKTTKATKPATQKKVTARKKSKTTATRNSVDSILEKFDKRRSEQQSKLAAVRKKIAQLEKKTKAHQAEIVSLKDAESKAEVSIGKLGLDRDQAVQKLLKKLGVKLVSETPVKPTKKKARNSTPRTVKRKADKTLSDKKSSALRSFPQTEDAPAVIQRAPFFDPVSRPPTSNGNSPSAPEVPPDSSSDELLDDQFDDQDLN